MGEMVAHGAGVDSSRVTGKQEGTEYFLFADRSDRTKVMAGIRQHPLGARRLGEGALLSTRTLTGRFSLKYSSPSLLGSFFKRCIMNNFSRNSARILAPQGVLCPEKSIPSIETSTVR